ncbi:hypothetical protein L7F22_015508 [Adiantum nelumboides]|nr:hypothetical protein [Adiantum nelumboides]
MPLPTWPPELSEEQRELLCRQGTDFALSHSILYRPLPSSSSSTPPLDAAIHAPISLFPTPFPRSLYEQGQALQPLYNDLYARIAVDDTFLRRVIGGNVILVDDFQERIWQIWKHVKEEGAVQTLHLGLFRSDYLLHQEADLSSLQIKQVEINTISSSFGPLCTRVSDLHRHLASSASYRGISPLLDVGNMPLNEALATLAAGLAAGHKAYMQGRPLGDAVVLFVVQDGERNVFDQRLIEYELLEAHGVRVQRATFKELEAGASLLGPARTLWYTQPKKTTSEEVSVVYYRAGYSPADYPSEREWQTRLMLERSQAIKCPTVALQLAGAKKVQQVLSDPGVLESFVKDASRAVCGRTNRRGNNVYRENIPTELQRLDELDSQKGFSGVKRREGYILMKLIQPPVNVGNYLVRSGCDLGAVLSKDVISELGIFGTVLFNEEPSAGGITVQYERSGGHLLRTKGRESDEGGVAVGYSVIDSPLLID